MMHPATSEAAATVVALISATHHDNNDAAAELIASLDETGLICCLIAAVQDLAVIWGSEADLRGVDFDTFVADVTRALDEAL